MAKAVHSAKAEHAWSSALPLRKSNVLPHAVLHFKRGSPGRVRRLGAGHAGMALMNGRDLVPKLFVLKHSKMLPRPRPHCLPSPFHPSSDLDLSRTATPYVTAVVCSHFTFSSPLNPSSTPDATRVEAFSVTSPASSLSFPTPPPACASPTNTKGSIVRISTGQ